MNKKEVLVTFSILLLIALTAGVTYFLTTSKKTTLPPTPITSPSPQTQPPTQTQKPNPSKEPANIPQNWQTYTSQKYGFQISFPSSFQALDDANNLYGWPNGVVLLYQGGQSYDISIEIWDTESQYKAKYPSTNNLFVYEINDQYLTISNNNLVPQFQQIIDTFQLL